MASDADTNGIGGSAWPMLYRAGAANLLAGGAGVAVCLAFKSSSAAGFAIGYALGVANMLWLVRIARKSVTMDPDRAGRFVTKRYYARFLITALALALLITKGIASPWPLIAGLSASIFVNICVTAGMAREEAS